MAGMVFNQDFVPSWNAIYSNLLNKVNKTLISANIYTSPFSQMLQNMECGQYVEDIHINLGWVLLQDTITNSDLFTDYTDDVAVAAYEVDVDLVFPSTYTEYVVRTGFSVLNNVGEIINALTANIRTTLEYHRTRLTKQMLYNAYQFGMLSCQAVDNVMSVDGSGKLAAMVNTTIDDFRTEINDRNVIYNNQTVIKDGRGGRKRFTIAREVPYVIMFNQYIRTTEFQNALNLSIAGKFTSGNENQDFEKRLITLNKEDFPNSIPKTDRSAVVGNNVDAHDVNFFEMPQDKNGNPLFSGKPQIAGDIVGFVIEPAAIKLFTQLELMTSWLNPATIRTTNRQIYRGIMQLGAFNKICAFVQPKSK